MTALSKTADLLHLTMCNTLCLADLILLDLLNFNNKDSLCYLKFIFDFDGI